MKIAILPGDGIGAEIVAEAQKVLERLRSDGLRVETEIAPIGGAGYDAARHPLPDATLALARSADAVLLGAVGGPQYDTLPRALRPEQGILGDSQGAGPVRQPAAGASCIRSSRHRPRSSPRWSPGSTS